VTALLREVENGCRRLRGTRVSGSIPIRQAIVDQALAQSPAAGRGVRIEILADNKLLVHYGAIHVEAVLEEVVETGASPRLSVLLSSSMIAWTLKRTISIPGVEIDGRRVTVDVASIAAVAPYRSLLPYVTAMRLSTAQGTITVQFEISIS